MVLSCCVFSLRVRPFSLARLRFGSGSTAIEGGIRGTVLVELARWWILGRTGGDDICVGFCV